MKNGAWILGPFAALALLACKKSKVEPASTAEAVDARPVTTCVQTAPRPTFVPTSSIEGSDSFHFKVDLLARFDSVDSNAIGVGGTMTDSYRAYEALSSDLTDAQADALVLHESPIVRGYMLERSHDYKLGVDVDPMTFAPLLRDDTIVNMRSGCSGGSWPMALQVLLHYRNSDDARAVALFRRGAEDAGLCMTRAYSIGALLPHDPNAVTIAESVLRAGDPAMVIAVLDGLDGADVAPARSLVIPFAKHESHWLRAPAAGVLGDYDDAASLELVRGLLEDREKDVVFRAKIAYLHHPLHDRAEVAKMIDADHYLARVLLDTRDEADLALFFDLEKAAPDPDGLGRDLVAVAHRFKAGAAPAFVALTRRILVEIPELRDSALCALQEIGDRPSIPDFLAALPTPSNEHRYEAGLCAIHAVGELGERSAIPRLEELVATRDELFQLDAARALLALRSKSSADVVELAATTGYAWIDRELHAIAAKLRAL